MLLNQTKFGGIIGCSQQNVSKMVKKGILTLENKKIDKDKGLQQLRDHNLLDENNKLKKERTKKEETTENLLTTQSLSFDRDPGYTTLADMSDDERKIYDDEQKQLFDEVQQKESEAKDKGISSDEIEDIMSLSTYADSKAHREKYLSKLAELDYKIKKGDYISKDEVDGTSFEAARMIRDALLNYPNKMSLRVVGKTDIKEISDVLMEEVHIILGNLSNES